MQDEATLREKIQQLEETCNQLGSKVNAWNADGLEEIYRFTSQYIEDSNDDPDAEEEKLDPEIDKRLEFYLTQEAFDPFYQAMDARTELLKRLAALQQEKEKTRTSFQRNRREQMRRLRDAKVVNV